jgi:NAD(P)-dependent dehydrogenase (short-subunit alcohol dehydrogenase family)
MNKPVGQITRGLAGIGRASADAFANAIVFTRSDEASYITGHILNVDGGQSNN